VWSKNTCSSALALKSLLGIVQLEPVSDRNEDFYSIVNGEKDDEGVFDAM